MFKLLSPLAIAGALLSLSGLGAGPAQALSKVTFVSGKGIDIGTCADPANPCRTFQFAIGQTNPGGEVKALDPAVYGAMVLTQSISISGVEGAGIDHGTGHAIAINAGPNDVVNLTHLAIDGLKTANNGIVLNSGGSLTITHCTVRNFVKDGILLQPTPGTATFLIADVTVSNNGVSGIDVFPPGPTGSAIGTLDHVLMHGNGSVGMKTDRNTNATIANVTVIDSVASNNGTGFLAASQGAMRLVQSTATDNGTGVFVNTDAESAGNNYIHGNGTNVAGFITPVGTQ
jgi:hypothetical protein